jgi:hypothetical protein
MRARSFNRRAPLDMILLLEHLLHRTPFEQIVRHRRLNLRKLLHRCTAQHRKNQIKSVGNLNLHNDLLS